MNELVALVRRPATGIWALLMVATAVSWTLGTHHADLAGNVRAATVTVLAIAFVKVYLVGRHFMELRHAPRLLRLLFAGLTVVVCAVLVGLYLATG